MRPDELHHRPSHGCPRAQAEGAEQAEVGQLQLQVEVEVKVAMARRAEQGRVGAAAEGQGGCSCTADDWAQP